MSGSISFNSIPPDLLVPLFYLEFDASQAGVATDAQRALIVGQCSTSAPVELTYVASVADAWDRFGINSQIGGMIAAYRRNDPVRELWALPLHDVSGGTQATGSIAVSGTATAGGTLALMIAGTDVTVAVAAGDTATAVGDAIEAAIGAIPTLPVTASNTTGTVTITAVNKGTVGTDTPIFLNYRGPRGGERTPAGLTVAITAMSGGATNPSLAGINDLLGDEAFDFIIHPYATTAGLDAFQEVLDGSAGRWAWNRMIYGGAFTAAKDDVADLIDFGGDRNDPHGCVWGVNAESPMPSYLVAALRTGAVAPALVADPARPLQALKVVGELPARVGARWRFSDFQSLLSKGIACAEDVGSEVYIKRCVSTYQQNAFGQQDRSWLDMETSYLGMKIARRLKGRVQTRFPRVKLADNGTRFGAGQAIVTPNIIRAELIDEYAAMEREGLVQRTDLFTQHLVVTRSASDPSRVDVLYPPYYVSGLRIFAVQNQFRLQAA